MAVNLPPPDPASLHPVPGVELGVAMAGVRKANRKDLLVMRLTPGSSVAGVFTQNRFCAAPVILARKHLRNEVHALVVNTGNANAGTGKRGLEHAMLVCEALASHLGCEPQQILPFSTGVIMEPLPVQRIVAALPHALLHQDDWLSAAEAIMTTDTVPKAYSRKVRLSRGTAVVTGIAKGAGMIRPDMATMLGFLATDARVPARALQGLLGRDVDECRRVAYAVAHSPLVKTAFFASDPNLGRILAAIGNSGVRGLDTAKLDLYIDAVRVAHQGGRDPAYREEQAVAAM